MVVPGACLDTSTELEGRFFSCRWWCWVSVNVPPSQWRVIPLRFLRPSIPKGDRRMRNTKVEKNNLRKKIWREEDWLFALGRQASHPKRRISSISITYMMSLQVLLLREGERRYWRSLNLTLDFEKNPKVLLTGTGSWEIVCHDGTDSISSLLFPCRKWVRNSNLGTVPWTVSGFWMENGTKKCRREYR